MAGELYLCATPTGNLEDITFRALRTLEEADLIVTEDTRRGIKFLNHSEIRTPMTSYHEYNKVDKARYPVEQLQSGVNIALITDVGTLGILDSGEELVRQCYEAGVEVTSPPGSVTCVTALTTSGLSTRQFCFEAFLPAEKGDKRERLRTLEELKDETWTIIIYEAPHHLVKTLNDLYGTLGSGRITTLRELTKKFETAFRTTFEEALSVYGQEEPKGKCVIVIEGKSPQELKQERIRTWKEMSIEEHVDHYISTGQDKKEAMKSVVGDRGISKRDVYQQFLWGLRLITGSRTR